MSRDEYDDLRNLSKEWLIDRLEHAVKTEQRLPPAIRRGALGMYDCLQIEQEPDDEQIARYSRFIATNKDVRLMDEVFSWQRHMVGTRRERHKFNQILLFRSVMGRGGEPLSWRKVAVCLKKKNINISYGTARTDYHHALMELYQIVAKVRDGKLDPQSKANIIIGEL